MTAVYIGLIVLGVLLVFAPLIGDWLAGRPGPPPDPEPEPEWFFTEWKRDNER
jgi:hypothetical protein